jgi:transposase-like protein
MERRKFSREFKLEAVKLVVDRGVGFAAPNWAPVALGVSSAATGAARLLTRSRWGQKTNRAQLSEPLRFHMGRVPHQTTGSLAARRLHNSRTRAATARTSRLLQ